MIREKERREKARELFTAYKGKKGDDATYRGTDYGQWDLWTPSDDEEDPW